LLNLLSLLHWTIDFVTKVYLFNRGKINFIDTRAYFPVSIKMILLLPDNCYDYRYLVYLRTRWYGETFPGSFIEG